MFRLSHSVRATVLNAVGSPGQSLGTIDHYDGFGGLDSTTRTILGIAASLEDDSAGTCDAAISVIVTATGIGVADKTWTIAIPAGATSGRWTAAATNLDLTQYRYFTVQAWCDTSPTEPPSNLVVVLTSQYPPSSVAGTVEGMFTITDIADAKRPDSPIGIGKYWQDLLTLAEQVARNITGRNLAAEDYDERGLTVEREGGKLTESGGTTYTYWLAEPTGAALAFSDFTTLTLNDDAVTAADVTIYADRLEFTSPGIVHAVYPGGWMRNATVEVVIRQAVIEIMHVLHTKGTAAGVSSIARSGGVAGLASDPYEQARTMLSPYTRARMIC
jgi:hypothetical protein